MLVQPGQERAAAFLETRRYGGVLGGTTEWSKVEGITYSPKRNSVFFAVSDVRYGMEDNNRQGKPDTRYDIGEIPLYNFPFHFGKCDARRPVNGDSLCETLCHSVVAAQPETSAQNPQCSIRTAARLEKPLDVMSTSDGSAPRR